MKQSPSFKSNITKFILDIIIFIGFLLAMDPLTTGIPIHEWLTLAGIAGFILHLLLNWNWIIGLTRKLFKKVAAKARLHYILNWLLFIDGVLVMLTGFMVSEVVLPALGLPSYRNSTWRELHALTADTTFLLLALHLALNWDWVVTIFKRYIWQPLAHDRKKQVPVVVTSEDVPQ